MAKQPSRKLSVYSNLSTRRKLKKDAEKRRKAEYLASLPKHPVKRFLYRVHPKRFWNYWFSKRGMVTALKLTGIVLLFVVLLMGALFAYFRKDLDQISPDELAKRVQTTVTDYYDRNGVLLWEDKGSGNYRLVVGSGDLSPYLKNATVSIEDKDFYKHGGVSLSGTFRAFINNLTGGSTQGGSTLTQQLVKQVFFSSQDSDRGITGIPRKIKEAILAMEVERTYTKDQILTMYLNESPYGGRRNGAESGAQTYFGVSAKDLTLPEAALLAAIPQDPSYFNPYNTAGNSALIARQHTVLDDMVSNGYITKAQADAAKAYPILDHLIPQQDQYDSIKAGHFVQMVQSQLEKQLGASVVGQGGLQITTTLDYRIQAQLETAMNTMFNSSVPRYAGFTDGASTVEDVKTGQIVAMLGSRSFDYPGFGQDNAAVSFIQPGSTIKGLVYADLFQQKPNGQQNYGSGSRLPDNEGPAINAIYGAPLHDDDGKSLGNITIRSALATSRNIPAVEAMYISGVKNTINEIQQMGGSSYCTNGQDTQVGLSAAIGGCGIKQVDLVNAYSSIARGGVYKPQSSVLEVKNSQGQILQKWTDTAGKQIINPQAAYIVSDILHDEVARRPLDGYHAVGMYIPGVDTATKTGTSDVNGQAKDIWMVSYSPVLAMAVWLGNPDTQILKNGTSAIPGPIIASVMSYAHQQVYASENLWKPGDWFSAPQGIQKIGGELYPSYYNSAQGGTNTALTFDIVSKRLATTCTPADAKVSQNVLKSTNPITKQPEYSNVPAGYDANDSDNVHHCDGNGNPTDTLPTISSVTAPAGSSTITVNVSQGTFGLSGGSGTVTINGQTVNGTLNGSSYTFNAGSNLSSGESFSVKILDQGYYAVSGTYTAQ